MTIDIDAGGYKRGLSLVLNKLERIGNIVEGGNVDISRINYALGNYYDILLDLNSIYNQQMTLYSVIKTDYDIWYSSTFSVAKDRVIAEYLDTKSIKPSVKEFEMKMKIMYKDEWKEWRGLMNEIEGRIRELELSKSLLDKYEKVLSTLSNNIRSEMKLVSN